MNKIDRKQLKEWAKNAVSKNYWKSVAATLIFSGVTFFFTYFLVYGLVLGVAYIPVYGIVFLASFIEGSGVDETAMLSMLIMVVVFGVMGLVFTAVGGGGKVFLANPLELGSKKYLLESLYRDETKFSEVGAGFNNSYKNIVKVLCVRDVYLILWSTLSTIIYLIFGMGVMFGGPILFALLEYKIPEALMGVLIIVWILLIYVVYFASFIPLYIKSLQYLFVPYILAENPDMPRKQAITLAKHMMCGNKKSVFVMHLSFLGWLILSGFTCGILHVCYVGPYMQYTTAAYYKALKQKMGI